MPHVSVSTYEVTAGMPFTVTITGTNTLLHPTVVWLTKSDFMYLAAQFALPDPAGKWTAVFTAVPMGEYVYYAQCGSDSDATGNQNGTVPKSQVVTEVARRMTAAFATSDEITLADYYPRHIADFGFDPLAPQPLAFAGFVTASAQQPGPLTPLVSFIPGDGNPAHFKFGIATVKGNHWYHDFGAVTPGPAVLRVQLPNGTLQSDLPMDIG